MKKLASITFFTLVLTGFLKAQLFQVKTDTIIYKKIDGHELEMIVYQPQINSGVKLPAIVFFFGGGWVFGSPAHFELQAKYLASRGIVSVCPDYRTKNRHNTTPFESVKDARSAMRYVKLNGSELGIDTSKIVAAGGSAGGHLAACTAVIDKINESTDDLMISPKPMAMVLFNPVVDTGKRGYGQEKVEGREFEISPVHHITSDVPPTLIMHGKADSIVPYENVLRFEEAMKQHGNQCRLIGYRNQNHGFFNFSSKPKFFKKTLRRTEKYLDKHYLLKGSSWINRYYRELKKEN